MNLFITKLSADSATLLETWIEHELKAERLCDDDAGLWLCSVYYREGTKAVPAHWKIGVRLQSEAFDWDRDFRFDLEGFDPGNAYREIRAAFITAENERRVRMQRAAQAETRARMTEGVAA